MRRAALALALAGLLLPATASAASGNSAAAAELARWQAQEARLHAIGWRLVTGNAPFCEASVPAIGLLLHDAGSYARPEAVRGALRLTGDIGVQAVTPGSPAEAAGLAPNDTLLTIGNRELATLPLDQRESWRRLADINSALEAGLRRDGRIALTWRDAGGIVREAELTGVPACPGRFELLSTGNRVMADGSRVLLGQAFAGFAYPDELLAAAVAHELAHNLLRHRARLDAQGRTQGNVRATEREADRMMPWLLANAGYPPEAAAEFMHRWGPGSPGGMLGGIMRARTHDGWDERADLIAAELPLVEAALASDGKADWRARFQRRET